MSDWDTPPKTYLYHEGGTLDMTEEDKRKARERERRKEAGEWPMGFTSCISRPCTPRA